LVVIAIIAVLAAILFPVFAKAREKARQTTCLNNQRQIALGITMYAQDNNSTFMPSSSMWSNALNLPANIFNCPSLNNFKGTGSMPAYGFNAALYGAAMGDVSKPATCPLTVDYNVKAAKSLYQVADWNKDLDPRHSDGVVLSCMDGHVSWEQIATTAQPGSGTMNAMTRDTSLGYLATLISRGYTPYDTGKSIVSYKPQFSVHMAGANTPTYSATTFTIPNGAVYQGGSAPVITIWADVAPSGINGVYQYTGLGLYVSSNQVTAAPTSNGVTTVNNGIFVGECNKACWVTQTGLNYSNDYYGPSATAGTVVSAGYPAWVNAGTTYLDFCTSGYSGSAAYFNRIFAVIKPSTTAATKADVSLVTLLYTYNNNTPGQPQILSAASGTNVIDWSSLVGNNQVGLVSNSNGTIWGYCQNLNIIYFKKPIPMK